MIRTIFTKNWWKKKWSGNGGKDYKMATWRFYFVLCWIAILFFALVARLVYNQFFNADFLVSKANDRLLRTIKGGMERGLIVDRNGERLAVSVPVGDIYIDRHDFKENQTHLKYEAELREMAKLLDIDYDWLLGRILDPKAGRVLSVKRRVDAKYVEFIAGLHLRGVYVENTLRRYYPTAEINAHVLGRTDLDGNGTEGVERQFNDYLLSVPEKSRLLKDRHGNVVEYLGVVREARHARNLVLSIDERIQQKAYLVLKYATEINQATSGSLVLLDAWTGEILAMVNSPSYNPNQKDGYEPYKARNRAVTDLYEPGSTTKPLIALKALALGKTSWQEVFNTYSFIVNGKSITDSHKMASGDLFNILKYSSNTGMARIALRMEPAELKSALTDFGYGTPTGIGFIGENKGRIPARSHWSEIDKATMGFGYGFMVTPLQIAQAYSILANHGIKRPLSILKVNQQDIPAGERVANEKDVNRVLEALEAVVEDGTGTQAAIAGYRIGGKTGTAKVAIAGGYGKDYVGAFAGIAPMSNPRFVMVVIINEPHAGKFYGGTVAGPVFAQVMERTLQLYNIPFDNLNADGSLRTPAQTRREMYKRRATAH